ncbi:MAG TPA: patatin-like phospholipase family protein [Bacteroidales bacterium]|nr:patatin-like phospholipase family protein [Bacteroidales bacterium]
MKKKYGISLSGGSARGLAHIGVLQALTEAGIRPQVVAGASMGAIIGALFAAGITPQEMPEFFKKASMLSFFTWKLPPHGGMLSSDKLAEELEEVLGIKTFEELQIPLYISVTNFSRGITEIISSGSLAVAVAASAAIPLIFKPVEMNGDLYVDGGVTDNQPVGPLPKLCRRTIASHVNHIRSEYDSTAIKDVAERTYSLAIYENEKPNLKKFRYVIDPPELAQFSLFDFQAIDEIVQIGYKETKRLLEEGKLR